MRCVSSTFTWLRLAVTVLLLILQIQSSLQQCLTKEDSKLPTNPTGRQALYNGRHDFSFLLLREINRNSPTDNILFSPYSTYHALLLAYFISESQTERSIHEVLHLDAKQNKIDVLRVYKLEKLQRKLITSSPNKSNEFYSASKIYVTKEVTVRECMEHIFIEEIEKIDFVGNPRGALQIINSWVEGTTHRRIKNFLPTDAIGADTNLVLVNAAFFKSLWEYKFDYRETKRVVFYTSVSIRTVVDIMTQEGTFNHGISETLSAHILELPYKDGSASMFVFLPPFSSETGIENILRNLNAQTFHEIVEGGALKPRRVIVSLPKFALEHQIELKGVLENLGLLDLMTDEADLSSLTGIRNVSLERGIHKASIEVNEEGSKDPESTTDSTATSSNTAKLNHFICNHPFIYVIYDKLSKAILFTGIFRRPS